MKLKQTKIIGLTGAARSGKDTAAGFLVAARGYERIAFADALRNMVMAGFGIEPEDMDGDAKEREIEWLGASPRFLLQTLGTEWGREHLGPDVWVKVAWRAMMESGAKRVVFTDVRFNNEAQAIRNSGGVVVRITRPSIGAVVREHVSESGIHERYVSHEIVNGGTLAELREAILKIDKDYF